MRFKYSYEILLTIIAIGVVTPFPVLYANLTSFEVDSTITNPTGYAERSSSPSRYANRANGGPGLDPFPWSVNFANFKPNHCAESTKVKTAFGDALELALTVLKADYNGPSFTRYFQPADELQVRAIFTALLQASTMIVGESVLDLWKLFTIHYDVTTDPRPVPSEDCSADTTLMGYLLTGEDDPRLGNQAVCVLCPRAFTYHNLRDIPCSDLDAVVSRKMDVIGSTILHEVLHWEYLITPFSEGEPLVDWELNPPNWPAPPDGYDPYNAMQINRLSTEPEKPGSTSPNPVRNPDNYVWLVLEAWWRRVCPHIDFSEALADKPGVAHPL